MIDGQFYTDSEADQAIRDACSNGSVATPQSAGAALEALGVHQQGATDKRSKHDSAKADTKHVGADMASDSPAWQPTLRAGAIAPSGPKSRPV